MDDEISYICGNCGEVIVIPLDYSQGSSQQFVEDCPICCCPNVLYIHFSGRGHIEMRSELE